MTVKDYNAFHLACLERVLAQLRPALRAAAVTAQSLRPSVAGDTTHLVTALGAVYDTIVGLENDVTMLIEANECETGLS